MLFKSVQITRTVQYVPLQFLIEGGLEPQRRKRVGNK